MVDSDDSSALRRSANWKSDQYRRNGWIDVFARPWIVDLVNCLFSIHSDRFAGLLSILYAGGRPVAAHFGIRSGPVLAHWFPAYDVQFRQAFSWIDPAPTDGRGDCHSWHYQIDMGTGTERYKHALKSYDLVREGVVARGAFAASAHQVRSAQVDWARRQVKRHPGLFRVADRLLQRSGRIG